MGTMSPKVEIDVLLWPSFLFERLPFCSNKTCTLGFVFVGGVWGAGHCLFFFLAQAVLLICPVGTVPDTQLTTQAQRDTLAETQECINENNYTESLTPCSIQWFL